MIGVYATVVAVNRGYYYVICDHEHHERRARMLRPGSVVVRDRVFGVLVDATGFTLYRVARHMRAGA